jgi:hypothetical protein
VCSVEQKVVELVELKAEKKAAKRVVCLVGTKAVERVE